MGYNRKGMMLRVQRIRSIAMEYYEPGRRDRSYKAVWEKHVRPQYGICYRTFLRYMELTPEAVAGQSVGVRAAANRKRGDDAPAHGPRGALHTAPREAAAAEKPNRARPSLASSGRNPRLEGRSETPSRAGRKNKIRIFEKLIRKLLRITGKRAAGGYGATNRSGGSAFSERLHGPLPEPAAEIITRTK